MASMYLCRDSNKMGEAITSIESRSLTIRVVFDVFESDREFIKVCGSLEENESVSSKLNMSEPQVNPWGWEGVGMGSLLSSCSLSYIFIPLKPSLIIS